MDYDEGKVDEMVLALLYLTSFTEQGFVRAWKGHDWDALNRLHESGLISDPKDSNTRSETRVKIAIYRKFALERISYEHGSIDQHRARDFQKAASCRRLF
jgi:Domain of unknown function (DUF6429)